MSPKSSDKTPPGPSSTSPGAKSPPKKKPSTRVVEVEVDPVLGKRASPEQVHQRQDEAYRLRLLGKTPEEIGEVFGVTGRQARKYIAAARERTLADLRKMEGKAGVVRQFNILNHVLEEALQAWEKSKNTKVVKTAGVEKEGVKMGDEPVGGLSKVKQKTGQREEAQIGDPAFLDRVLKASAELRALIGLDAPEVKRILVADDPITKDLEYEDLRTLPAEELLKRYRAKIGLG